MWWWGVSAWQGCSTAGQTRKSDKCQLQVQDTKLSDFTGVQVGVRGVVPGQRDFSIRLSCGGGFLRVSPFPVQIHRNTADPPNAEMQLPFPHIHNNWKELGSLVFYEKKKNITIRPKVSW